MGLHYIKIYKETVHEIKVVIVVVLNHCTEFRKIENLHLYCPQGTDILCKYWKVKLNNENKIFEKPGMAIAVYDIAKPIF